MIVKVIYPSHGSPEKTSRIEFDVELIAEEEYLALDDAYRLVNRVTKEDTLRMKDYAKQIGVKSIRSAMVGDIFCVNENYYICDSAGWQKIEKDAVENWCNISVTDRLMGVKWCMEKILNKI